MKVDSVSHSVFLVRGEKAAPFLHGQLTNDIKSLGVGSGNYNLLLNQKGKVRADLFVYRIDEGFYLIIPKQFSEIVASHLQKLAPLSKVEIKEVETHGYESPQCHASLRQVSFNLDKITRVEEGVALVGHDVTEENFPQEGRLDSALSFTKGCYLGQEIIARLHYRGHVNKILSRLMAEDDLKEIVPEGEPIFLESQVVGKITSSVYSPQFKKNILLGYVPYSQKDFNGFFEVGNSKRKGKIF